MKPLVQHGKLTGVSRWRVMALGILCHACGFTVYATDVVTVDALRKTDCADLKVTRGSGGYVASGCGKTLFYKCDRPAGTGVSKLDAIANAGCREEPRPTGSLRAASF